MSELTTGGINFSPEIQKIYSNVGFTLSDEYKRGYAKGRASIIEEFEKLKVEIEEDKKLYSYNEHIQKGHSNCIDIVNSYISELKGEDKPDDWDSLSNAERDH